MAENIFVIEKKITKRLVYKIGYRSVSCFLCWQLFTTIYKNLF